MENLIPIGRTIKPKVVRIIAISILMLIIIGIVFIGYSGLKYGIPDGEKYCYIPFIFLHFMI